MKNFNLKAIAEKTKKVRIITGVTLIAGGALSMAYGFGVNYGVKRTREEYKKYIKKMNSED